MISHRQARKQAADFLDRENLPKLSEALKEGTCASVIFPQAVKSLGKKRVLILYRKLPSEFRKYFLVYFLSGSERLNEKLRKIDAKSDFPGGSKHLQAVEKALVKYLKE